MTEQTEQSAHPDSPEALLRAFGARLAAGDADGVAALFTEDASYAEPPAYAFQGRDAMRAFVRDFAARHHDVSFDIIRTLGDSDGTEAAAEWRFAYTRNEDGVRRVFEGMSFVRLRDGLIAEWRGFSARME